MTAHASHQPSGRYRFRQLARMEWIKLRSLRSTWLILAIAVAASAGIALATGSSTTSGGMFVGNTLAGMLIGVLLIGVVGVLAMTSEYTSGTIRATFAAAPRRLRVLAAKAAVVGAVALITGEAAAFLSFFAGCMTLRHGITAPALSQPGVLRAIVLTGASLSLIGLFGLGLGAIRPQACPARKRAQQGQPVLATITTTEVSTVRGEPRGRLVHLDIDRVGSGSYGRRNVTAARRVLGVAGRAVDDRDGVVVRVDHVDRVSSLIHGDPDRTAAHLRVWRVADAAGGPQRVAGRRVEHRHGAEVPFPGSLSTYKVWVSGSSAESCGLTPTTTVLPCAGDGELEEVAPPPEAAVLHAASSARRDPASAPIWRDERCLAKGSGRGSHVCRSSW